jgi:hypothetical protein
MEYLEVAPAEGKGSESEGLTIFGAFSVRNILEHRVTQEKSVSADGVCILHTACKIMQQTKTKTKNNEKGPTRTHLSVKTNCFETQPTNPSSFSPIFFIFSE